MEDRTLTRIRVRRLPAAEGLPLPQPASVGAAGADLRAATEGDLSIQPGQRLAVPTGLIFEIPPGWEGQVRPRSGLALRHGVTVVNAPGTIDSDYRGEVKVLLINLGQEAVTVRRGDRIAQLVVAAVATLDIEEIRDGEALSSTDRGEGGFGSTGQG
jgi:dUTP pyrophosphatase